MLNRVHISASPMKREDGDCGSCPRFRIDGEPIARAQEISFGSSSTSPIEENGWGMAPSDGNFNVAHERSGDTVVLSSSGELDIATSPYVEDVVRTILSAPPKILRLDWSGITFMDSSGIRLLLWIVRAAKENNIDLLWVLSAPAQRVLDAVGIH